jgi:hypothetical protein
VEGTARRLLGAIRVEDGLLAGWSLALPFAAAWFGAAPGEAGLEGPMPLIGAVQLLAVLGAIAALLTRPADQPPVRIGQQDAPRWIIVGPLIGALSFTSADAVANLGLGSGDWLLAIALLAILVGTLAADRLPVVRSPVRRALVLPFILLSATYFNGFAAVFIDGLDLNGAIASSPPGEIGFAIFILFLVVAGMAVFYTMLVVAPRELADPEESGPRWVIRFAMFVAASLLGVGWLALIGP